MSIILKWVHINLRPTVIFYDLPKYIPTKMSPTKIRSPKNTTYLAKIRKNFMKKINFGIKIKFFETKRIQKE